MRALTLLAEAGGGGQVEQIARTFGVDWPHLFAQIVSFSIVCAVLYLLAYKPILNMLAERRQLIAQGLANSEKIKAELAKTEALRHEALAQAGAQATRMIEEARDAAARLRERETRKAVAAAEQVVAQAREAAAHDRARMLAQLKGEVGRLVVQTTAALAGRVLTADDQRRLSEETASELKAGRVKRA